jgi:hypothetical protein
MGELIVPFYIQKKNKQTMPIFMSHEIFGQDEKFGHGTVNEQKGHNSNTR